MKVLASVIILFISVLGFGQSNTTYAWQRASDCSLDLTKSKVTFDIAHKNMTFDALRFQVKGAGLTIKRIVVEFKDGETTEIKKKLILQPNGKSKTLLISKGTKLVNNVTVYYDNKKESVQKATLVLWAMMAIDNSAANG